MFDPSELTVKKARSLLSGLDLSELQAVLAAEIDGKHRSSLIAEIGQAIDALKTEEEATPEAAPEGRKPSGGYWGTRRKPRRRTWAASSGDDSEGL